MDKSRHEDPSVRFISLIVREISVAKQIWNALRYIMGNAQYLFQLLKLHVVVNLFCLTLNVEALLHKMHSSTHIMLLYFVLISDFSS